MLERKIFFILAFFIINNFVDSIFIITFAAQKSINELYER